MPDANPAATRLDPDIGAPMARVVASFRSGESLAEVVESVLFGWVEVEPAALEAFTVGVFVGAVGRLGWCPGGLGSGPAGCDGDAVFVGERDAVGVVGVAGDTQFAAVVQTVVAVIGRPPRRIT